MKLDTKALRYLTSEDWRVLTAVEQGSKNHEVVPTPLIAQLSKLRGGSGVHKSISTLAKANLIARTKNAKYDGYRLTYGGLDYLALHAHTKSGCVYSVGNQIGVGKESDIFVVAEHSGTQRVLKIHRLGRISFRTVKANRDYLRNRSSGSWMYMSRLAAQKEHVFMAALRENGFVVPQPLAWNRHTVVMELVDAFPLRQITEVPDPAGLYAELIEMIMKLAGTGLIHGDFNEFNILIKEEKTSTQEESKVEGESKDETLRLTPVLIDFPQMVSMDHANAEMYFKRDVDCIKRFFTRRFGFTSDDPGPTFSDAKNILKKGESKRLDLEAQASGFNKKMAKELEAYMREHGVDGDGGASNARSDEDGEDGEDGESDEGTEREDETTRSDDGIYDPSTSSDHADNQTNRDGSSHILSTSEDVGALKISDET